MASRCPPPSTRPAPPLATCRMPGSERPGDLPRATESGRGKVPAPRSHSGRRLTAQALPGAAPRRARGVRGCPRTGTCRPSPRAPASLVPPSRGPCRTPPRPRSRLTRLHLGAAGNPATRDPRRPPRRPELRVGEQEEPPSGAALGGGGSPRAEPLKTPRQTRGDRAGRARRVPSGPTGPGVLTPVDNGF